MHHYFPCLHKIYFQVQGKRFEPLDMLNKVKNNKSFFTIESSDNLL